MDYFQIVMLVTALAFFGYGLSCIFGKNMREEFMRFELAKWRILTGILQLLGALGLAFGIYYSSLGALASFGLAILMLLGFITRLRINDGILQAAPSLLLMFLNMYLCYYNYMLL